MGLKQQPKCKEHTCRFCDGKYCTILKSKPKVCNFYKVRLEKTEDNRWKKYAETVSTTSGHLTDIATQIFVVTTKAAIITQCRQLMMTLARTGREKNDENLL